MLRATKKRVPGLRPSSEAWQIGKPDLVFELPKPYEVPASGVIDYQHIILHTGFTKDTWAQAAEVRPTWLASSTCFSQPIGR